MGETLRPITKADPLIDDAVRRAFGDQATRYFDGAGDDLQLNLESRRQILDEIDHLGFCDALDESFTPEQWPDAAAIIRAQAYSGLPVDMVDILIRRDRDRAIAHESGQYQAMPIATTQSAEPAVMLEALGRCFQMNAAMRAAVDLSLQYVQDRKQFGRPLSAFQAIQHSLAIAAEQVAAATAATDLAMAALIRFGNTSQFQTLLRSSALMNGSAVTEVFEISHQVHGAIGFTREYSLHRHTLNLLAWRDALQQLLGADITLAQSLGQQVADAGGVWLAVTNLMDLRGKPQP